MASEATKRPLIEHFSALKDPRQIWKVVYPLPEIMLLVLCATLAGAEDFVEVRLWGCENLDFLRRFCRSTMAFPPTIPSTTSSTRSTRRSSRPALWPGSRSCATPSPTLSPSTARLRGARTTAARAASRCILSPPGRPVSAWCSGRKPPAKSNEITAIPLLLERLALTGALVTLDAMGCQTKIAHAIQAKGADDLIAVKDNWPNLHGEIERFFAAPSNDLDRHATTDGDHGRIESRRHVVSHDVAWLSTDRRFPGKPRFPGLAAIAMVEAEVERGGKTPLARRYYLSSALLEAPTFARAVRAHWGVENRLHWVMDVVFHDDLARLRTGHGPENMAIIKHMAMNLVQQATPTTSLKNRRKLAGWDPSYLETLIQQTA